MSTAIRPHLYYLVAGGTGGHIMPALSIATTLIADGHHVLIITDKRGRSLIPSHFSVKQIRAASPFTGQILQRIMAVGKLAIGLIDMVLHFIWKRPSAIIGFGGYPSFAPVLAGWIVNIPVLIHEQNAVIGRANLHLSRFAKCLMTSWPHTDKAPLHTAIIYTGLPIRQEFSAIAAYKPKKDRFHLAIFGGSLGTAIFAETIPEAIKKLSPQLKEKLTITQQVRIEQKTALDKIYQEQAITAKTAPFFNRASQIIAEADLLICRAGASSVMEIAQAGRPAIFIPFAHALDDHQTRNAQMLATQGAAICLRESEASAEKLAGLITQMMKMSEKRKLLASQARQFAQPKANRQIIDTLKQVTNHKSGEIAA